MSWNDAAVSPVIATILMVAITVVLAGVIALYMQQIEPIRGDNVRALLDVDYVPEDPELDTVGLGHWKTQIISVSGNAEWKDVTVSVRDSHGILLTKCQASYGHADHTQATLGTSMEEVEFFICEDSNGSARYDKDLGGDGNTDVLDTDFGKKHFVSLEGVRIAVVDNGADGKLSVEDVIFVFRDFDGDGNVDVDDGSEVRISVMQSTATLARLTT